MFTVKLLDSIGSVKAKVNQACADHLNKSMQGLGSKLTSRFISAVNGWIVSQPEIMSLNTAAPSTLMAQFGLTPGQSAMATAQIIQAVQRSISVTVRKFDKNLNGGISVYIQPSSFQNILSLGSGHVVYAKGDLHWLDWLIRMGDTIIVADYDYNPNTGRGRSGLGNMKKGGSFRVPPEFSGTLENNFITRALIGSEQEEMIAKIFKEVLA
tara:strand:- start:2147 stop:2779 length:633 start_codon:yes stop_codon:yes gene_type:complete